MERQIPKNVRQIGNVSDSPKIYVEDYVDTFFAQLSDKYRNDPQKPLGAFLIGDFQTYEGEDYVYIYGAIQMQELRVSGMEYLIDDETWKRAYEECKQFFEEGELIGWFVVKDDAEKAPGNSTVKLHKKSFPKKNTVFIICDPQEKEETYYVHKMNDLMEIGGHYTYYEKNPCMQDYMISSRKKNGAVQTEVVEDKAAQNFRDLARKQGKRTRQKHQGNFVYAMSVGLVLVLVIMGVAMLNNFNKIRKAQNQLEEVAGTINTVKDAGNSGNSNESNDPNGGQADDSEKGTADENTGAEKSNSVSDKKAEGDDGTSKNGTDGTASANSSQAKNSQSDEVVEASAVPSSSTNGSDGVYVVEKGDTLAIISKKMYGDVTHIDAICRMNGLSNGNLIYIGQKLLLP
ncbi:LysM peptidoglycan-binding domain-containing protein [[Ruminococcus] lactaris]|uniref:LysM peptidoglycan-binding domain-containing protein n=1 Tax=[Ruminococcus] lactaris TaxID=46228 RepID=UPI003FD7AF1A